MVIVNTDLEQNIELAPYSGIKVGGKAAWFCQVEDIKAIMSAARFADKNNLVLVPIGSGTNMFYGPGKLNILAIENKLIGKEVVKEDDDFVDVSVASGENWDQVVGWTVENGWSGVEALSAIPGTVGAAPVQNIGAYGQEVSEVILSIEVIDLDLQTSKVLTNKECDFSYRNSIFKQNPGKYFITRVVMRLTKNHHPGIPNYESAKAYFDDQKINNPSLQQIREGITNIRWSKLPKPEILPNCGSWFKNPIVSKVQREKLQKDYPEIKYWEVNDSEVKLSAGWLVDQTVGKDYEDKYFATYGKNALVLINHSLSPSPKKLLKFEAKIIDKVQEKFGVKLEREPILVN